MGEDLGGTGPSTKASQKNKHPQRGNEAMEVGEATGTPETLTCRAAVEGAEPVHAGRNATGVHAGPRIRHEQVSRREAEEQQQHTPMNTEPEPSVRQPGVAASISAP